MTDLITRVRGLINDPSGASEHFADQDIQDQLDVSRNYAPLSVLKPTYTLQSSGTVNYSDYWADMGYWETNVTIQNGAFQVLSDMATSDYLTGHWTWSLPTPGKVPPIFITGFYYDVYRAAAELLDKWSASFLMSYDFSSDGQSFKRSQVAQGMRDLAKEYRKQAIVHTMPMIRSDMTDDSSSTNVVVGNTDVMGW